jgi:AcrR family transcriptional regulator
VARTFTRDEQQAKKQALLAALGRGLSLAKSIKEVGVALQTVYTWKNGDGIFAAAVDAALVKRPDRAPSRQPVARKAAAVPEAEQGDVIEEVCKAIRAGLPIDYACLLANIHRGTLRKWMTDCEETAARVNRAQAQNLLWWISKLRQGAEKDWRAALAYLERVFPALFAEVRQIELSQREVGEPKIIDVTPEATIKRLTEMTDEELQSIIGRGTV